MKVLITGFDPFGGESSNPAYESVRLLPNRLGSEAGTVEIVRAEVPTQFGRSVERLEALMAEHRPDVVLCVGQAGGRTDITPERVAINVDDARIPDNAGNQPIDRPVVAGGPAAYFASIPIKAIVRALREQNIPASVSNSAGTYVCNHLMYGLMHRIRESYPSTRGGFIHVPYSDDQTVNRPAQPSLPLETIARALEIAIRVCAETQEDLHESGGAIS